MASITALLLLPVVLSASPNSYDAALRQAQEQQQPLLVLVGAEWCPGCRTMKQSVLPRMSGRGRLAKVSFAIVDADREAALARQLMRGNSIPQLIVFAPTENGQWHREQIVGATSEAAVESLIKRAVEAQNGAQ